MAEQLTQDGLYPVRLDRMMEALRFAEYELTSGLGELVDNSVEAGAQNIWVATKTIKAGKKTDLLDEVAVIDDGSGMDAEILRKCLVLGEGHRPPRIGGPAHIGRFGVGLSLGGISLAQRIEVYSRDNPQNEFLFTFLDLTEIRQGAQTHIAYPIVQNPPEEFETLLENRSGTIVLLQKCDRLQHDATGEKQVNASKHIDGLAHYLGRTYRRFIDGGTNIWFNGDRVYLHDPLYMLGPTQFDAKNPQKPDLKATSWGTIERIDLDIPSSHGQTAQVTICMSLLPREWRAKQGAGGSPFARARHIDENEGISILRADREVLYNVVPYIIGQRGQARPLDIDRFWGCEISFPPELDDYFQVRYIKRGAEPLQMLRDMIRDRISRAVDNLRDEIRKGMKPSDESLTQQEATFREAEDIMAEADRTSPKGKRNDAASEAQAEEKFSELVEQEVRAPLSLPTVDQFTSLPLPFDVNNPEIIAQPSPPPSQGVEAERKKERKRELLEKPYSIVPVRYPSNVFFETLHQMGRVVIKLNVEHPFYKEVFEPLCGSIKQMSEDSDVYVGADTAQKRKARHAFMLLLLAYGKGETWFTAQEQIEILNSHREQWGIALATPVRRMSERG